MAGSAQRRTYAPDEPDLYRLASCWGVVCDHCGASHSLTVAYQLKVSSGSLIVCLTTVIFAVLVLEPRRGAIARAVRRRRTSAV